MVFPILNKRIYDILTEALIQTAKQGPSVIYLMPSFVRLWRNAVMANTPTKVRNIPILLINCQEKTFTTHSNIIYARK